MGGEETKSSGLPVKFYNSIYFHYWDPLIATHCDVQEGKSELDIVTMRVQPNLRRVQTKLRRVQTKLNRSNMGILVALFFFFSSVFSLWSTLSISPYVCIKFISWLTKCMKERRNDNFFIPKWLNALFRLFETPAGIN